MARDGASATMMDCDCNGDGWQRDGKSTAMGDEKQCKRDSDVGAAGSGSDNANVASKHKM